MLLNTYEPWKFAFSAETDFENIKKDSYGIIGVPFDSTTSYHSGSRLGPVVVREASYGFEKYNTNFKSDLDTTFYDFGDVNVVPGNCQATCNIVEDTVRELLDLNVKPITIGGEHSASIGVIKALTEKYDKLTVVHLDAHRDLAFDFIGEKYSHATVMRRAHEFGVDLVQIGIRSSSLEEEEFVKSTYNIRTFKNKDVHKHMDAVEYYLATVETPIYLSIDMDVFDPAIAPCVGNPSPGGLFTSEIEDVIKALAFKEVVGMDVVETATDRLGENTAVTAAKIIYDFLSLI
ncbi:MAG: agmatinase [Methanobrevibacter sp.]|uniref:Agmatinase n=1 Tax=Methanobrevibacter millerae TaxID=230361 RepID=A0A8T3V935_9EURY|nr:agmatinase [Methanobrevibacter millerae]MBE6504588.1 agmatinase [Methanobrevibacter millerae]MBR0058318.1 agmatinase [Methanobrevibacter sp.]MBR0369825.1 agmatinase [Methanobrevibacter sp.]